MQDGDEVKQEKVLQLLDEYVLHVDRGRTAVQTEQSLDLLDQYVMHVDRGAHVDLEAARSWQWDVRHQAGLQEGGSRAAALQNTKALTRRGSERNLTQNIKRERGDGDKWGTFRAIDRERGNIRGIRNGNKSLIKPKKHLRSTHGIRAKRSLREDGMLEGAIFSHKRRQKYREENEADIGLKLGQGYRSNIDDDKGIQEEFTAAHPRQRRSIETGNRTVDWGEEPSRDLITGPWTHTVQLGDSVHLSWNVLEGDEIEFLVEAATRGYVGVGFSPEGGMAAADIMLAWVDDITADVFLVVSSLSHMINIQGGPDSIRKFLIINNQSIQQHTGKWESTFCCR
jgi:hypothetical protein